MAIINAGSKSVASLLKDDCYYIPSYQRGYSWTSNQWEDLWMDLMKLYEEVDPNNYFFGQVVLHRDEVKQKTYVIDGQQRMSTVVILLDVLRNAYIRMYQADVVDAKYEAEDLTTMYIGRTSDKRFEPRLFLNNQDRLFFVEYIQKEKKISVSSAKQSHLTKSETLIYQASLYFEKELKRFLEAFAKQEEGYKEMKRLMQILLNDFTVMVIKTQDVNEAYVIFETLNARGMELTTADLLKNHVYRTAKSQLADVKTSWELMTTNLDGSDPTRFIRHYWNAQYPFIREKDLYSAIRRKIDSPATAVKLVHDLATLSELYISLNYPNKRTYFKEPLLIEQNREINNLGSKSYYPIIIALVMKDTPEPEIMKIHEAIECLIVRNFTIAGKAANRSEKIFASIARYITRDKLRNSDEILQILNSLMVEDEEFYNNFKIFTVKRANTIRYLLRKMHNHSNNEMRILSNNQEIHIEHILPKKIEGNNGWQLTTDEHERLLHRFGNLTLLGQEYNRSALNKGFKEKLKVYERSEIPLTRGLINYPKWTAWEIESRQKQLAKKALEIWRKY